MVFEMPEEISGQKNRNVVCQGRVIRTKDQAKTVKKEPETDDAGLSGGLDRRLQVHPLRITNEVSSCGKIVPFRPRYVETVSGYPNIHHAFFRSSRTAESAAKSASI